MNEYELRRIRKSAQSWLDRTDPRAKTLVEIGKNERKVSEETWLEMARLAFERECVAEGIDPAKGVSPTLLRSLEARRGEETLVES